MNITVFGLWHLGCVTAACLADMQHRVIGLDLDDSLVAELTRAQVPIFEPGLADLITQGLEQQNLSFSSDPRQALVQADVVWVTFDTPVNDRDEADPAAVRIQLDHIVPFLALQTLVLISSQVPVGFTRALKHAWGRPDLLFAYSPENLRLGKALDVFRHPERIVVGVDSGAARERLQTLFENIHAPIEWMSIESAEMTKHALNAFLATSVTFINELARLCEAVGADAKEVERGLKTEGRIGPRAYLSPGAAFAGGTLARDVRFLIEFGQHYHKQTPLLEGILASNEAHKSWLHTTITIMLKAIHSPVVTVLGLTYKPQTSTLRRSTSVELCKWLHAQGIRVQAHDPAITTLPEELQPIMHLYSHYEEALQDADIAVLATEWPEYRQLQVERIRALMRTPQIIDQNWFLAASLSDETTITYVATGRGQLEH